MVGELDWSIIDLSGSGGGHGKSKNSVEEEQKPTL